ncbi:MAG: EF-hand domain-containing protein [Planctomycetia bacterium]|nr:EF-hand domain-containing protein [Planctomycetia bacterium]
MSSNKKVTPVAIVLALLACLALGYSARAVTSSRSDSTSFDAYDKDKDGVMSRVEFNEFLRDASLAKSGASDKKAATKGGHAGCSGGGCSGGGCQGHDHAAQAQTEAEPQVEVKTVSENPSANAQ